MLRENLDDREILNKIDDSISQMDEQRLSELNSLKRIQEIKNEIYKLEAKKTEIRYGPDHPRIIKFQRRMEYNQEMFVGLDKEIEKAKVKKEPLPKNAWRIHGRVFDKNNVLLKGQTVVLSVDDQRPNENLPRSISDDLGYFSITVGEDIHPGSNGPEQVYLKVINKAEETLYKSKMPFTIKKGIVDFYDIYIEENGEIV